MLWLVGWQAGVTMTTQTRADDSMESEAAIEPLANFVPEFSFKEEYQLVSTAANETN